MSGFAAFARRSRVRAGVAGLAAVAFVIAGGCSAEEPAPKAKPSPTPTSPATPTATHAAKTQRWPLTGRPVKGKLPDRPVLLVKVDNTSNANPQKGLRWADLVVEELVEGGLTRLMAGYHSKLPPVVGPVRSIRTTDLALAAPVNGTLVASGGAGRVRAAAKRVGVRKELGGPGYFRVGNRPAPYNLMLHPRALAKTQPDRKPKHAFLPWASDQADLGGTSKHALKATFSPGHTTRLRFHKGRGWVRVGGPVAANQDFVADTVVVLRVHTRDAGYRDPGGNRVPETILKGHGRAWILAGPHLVKARWGKDGHRDPLRFSKDGERLALPPGNTYIALVPTSGSVTAK